MGMQLSAPPTLLLVLMILLLIFPQNVAAQKNHEHGHDQEQEEKLCGTLSVSHDRDFIDGIGYFFAQPPAPDVARKQHLDCRG